MPLFGRWSEEGGLWGIWKVTETAGELENMLCRKSFFMPELESVKAPKRRLEMLATRVLLKTLLGEEKRMAHLPSGRPCLEDDGRQITVSHTGGYVAVGIHEESLPGIDIEHVGERVRKVASRFVRPDEMPGVERMDGNESLYRLLLHWSAKESMYKVMELDEVDFCRHLRVRPFPFAEKGTFVGEEFRSEERRSFRIHYFIHPDFVCTYCVRSV